MPGLLECNRCGTRSWDRKPSVGGELLSPHVLRNGRFCPVCGLDFGQTWRTDEAPEGVEPVYFPTPHGGADPNHAGQLNIQYQEELTRWKALPWWKRLTVKKPEPPKGI